MRRLLSIVVFLVGCQGASGPPVGAKPVEAVQDCAALCSEIRQTGDPAPKSSARGAGEACLCFEPLEAAGTRRPTPQAAAGGKAKKPKGKKKKRR